MLCPSPAGKQPGPRPPPPHADRRRAAILPLRPLRRHVSRLGLRQVLHMEAPSSGSGSNLDMVASATWGHWLL